MINAQRLGEKMNGVYGKDMKREERREYVYKKILRSGSCGNDPCTASAGGPPVGIWGKLVRVLQLRGGVLDGLRVSVAN